MPKGKHGEHEPMLDMEIQPPGHRACSGGPHWAPEADFLYDKPRAGKLMAATCRYCRERSRQYQLERKAYYKMKSEGTEMQQELETEEDHESQSSAPERHNDEPEPIVSARGSSGSDAIGSALEVDSGDTPRQENEITQDRACTGTRCGEDTSSSQDKIKRTSDYNWDHSLLDVGKDDTTEHRADHPSGQEKGKTTSGYEWDYSLLDIGAGATAKHEADNTSGQEKPKTTTYEWDYSLLDTGTSDTAGHEAQTTSGQDKPKRASDYEWDYSLLDIGTGDTTGHIANTTGNGST